MAIDYAWTCTVCGAANAAGTDACHLCGCPAITSGRKAIAWVKGDRSTPLSAAERFLVALLSIMVISGPALLWIFNPPDVAWWVGVGILAATLILLGVVKLLRGSK